MQIDGILGFDRRSLSIVSQLSSRGISGKVFSHCLKGERENGGGILVLGEIQNPSMVYTPLVPSTYVCIYLFIFKVVVLLHVK